ncbi:hypothetical protein [Oryza sativa Japonica Group]|uniref:Uncharacterized protein n=1 Tax=Oryza sativa subsp. japonica TaxID=39947 RepID=Q5JKB6_ORYSJ|nr:hypothetical protein [Oryza sativa Japonica Group]
MRPRVGDVEERLDLICGGGPSLQEGIESGHHGSPQTESGRSAGGDVVGGGRGQRGGTRLVPNDYIVIMNNGRDKETLGEGLRVMEDHPGCPSQGGGPNQVDLECNSESRTSLH